jgi:hypothetical protein
MSFFDESLHLDDLPIDEERSFEPLPDGWYTSAISSCEERATKAGTGKYLAMCFTITGPTHINRTIFSNLNVINPSPGAEAFGRRKVREIMLAIGITKLESKNSFIGGELAIKLKTRQDPGYGAQNEVDGFKAITGSKMPAPPEPAPEAEVKKAKSLSPPWAN